MTEHFNDFLQGDMQSLHLAVITARVEVIKYLVNTVNVPINATAIVSQLFSVVLVRILLLCICIMHVTMYICLTVPLNTV